MNPINPAISKFLTEKDHTPEELSSFSIERAQENSARTKIANFFRGYDKRCLELIQECKKIAEDPNSKKLTNDEKTNLKDNAWELFIMLRDSNTSTSEQKTTAQKMLNVVTVWWGQETSPK